MRDFYESLQNGFRHIDSITDKTFLEKLREQGVSVDEDGIYCLAFGDNHEYEWYIFPLDTDSDEKMMRIALYKNGVLISQELDVWIRK